MHAFKKATKRSLETLCLGCLGCGFVARVGFWLVGFGFLLFFFPPAESLRFRIKACDNLAPGTESY